MTLRIQIFIAIVLIIALGMIINMVRKRSLELKYVLLWIFCDLAVLIIDIFPNIMVYISQFLGIQSQMNMMFFFGFIFSLIIIFSLTVSISRMTEKIRRLTQMLALREDMLLQKIKEVDELKREIEAEEDLR